MKSTDTPEQVRKGNRRSRRDIRLGSPGMTCLFSIHGAKSDKGSALFSRPVVWKTHVSKDRPETAVSDQTEPFGAGRPMISKGRTQP
ncbi:MAG: hypothetical protein U1F77_05140 [Kiritimatiellia bacterium]